MRDTIIHLNNVFTVLCHDIRDFNQHFLPDRYLHLPPAVSVVIVTIRVVRRLDLCLGTVQEPTTVRLCAKCREVVQSEKNQIRGQGGRDCIWRDEGEGRTRDEG